jgi:hypothetical protein
MGLRVEIMGVAIAVAVARLGVLRKIVQEQAVAAIRRSRGLMR